VLQGSMDWFKGKSKPETIDFPIKYRGFRFQFSRLNQSIERITTSKYSTFYSGHVDPFVMDSFGQADGQ
jgi:hypothetical protein